MFLFNDLFFRITKYVFKTTSWFLWSVGSKQTISQRFYPKNISRINFMFKICLHKFLQIQPVFQKQFIKQSAWLEIICFADSIDIKFVKFGHVDQKLCNLQIKTTNRNVSVF